MVGTKGSFEALGHMAYMGFSTFRVPYFTDHKAHSKSFFFSRIDRASYKPVRLMYGSGSALCFIAYTQNQYWYPYHY